MLVEDTKEKLSGRWREKKALTSEGKKRKIISVLLKIDEERGMEEKM